jgi:hypothetical protein
MKKIVRLILALLVLFSGATLVPAMGLPDQGFTWQIFANAYQVLQVFLPIVIR